MDSAIRVLEIFISIDHPPLDAVDLSKTARWHEYAASIKIFYVNDIDSPFNFVELSYHHIYFSGESPPYVL